MFLNNKLSLPFLLKLTLKEPNSQPLLFFLTFRPRAELIIRICLQHESNIIRNPPRVSSSSLPPSNRNNKTKTSDNNNNNE